MTRYARKYRRIARSLSRADLMRRSMDLTFTLDDIDLDKQREGRRFLDFYSEEGIRLALERYGLSDALARRGFVDLEIFTRADDERHTLLISGRSVDIGSDGQSEVDAGRSPLVTLVELVVRRDLIKADPPPGLPVLDAELEALTIDWLSLRNPRAAFSEARPRLPGQDAPGLGVGERVLEMLYRMVERLALDTLSTVPEYFHNAVLYARELPFLDPWYGGQLGALEHVLLEQEGLGLAQASWAIEWGFVRRGDGSVFKWRGQLMVWTHGERLTDYLRSPAYAAEVTRIAAHERFTLDRAAFDTRWRAERAALTGAL